MIYYHLLRSQELVTFKLLANIVNPPTDYILHCTIEPLGTNSVWSAILLFTNDINSNSGNYGDRTPVVFFPPDSTSLSITTGTNADPNDHNDNNPTDELPLNMPTTVRIEVLGTIRKVFINNAEVISDSIGTRSQLAEVDAYLGNPHYAAANAMVSDMVFTSNSFSRYDLLPEPELYTTPLLANIVNPPTDYVLQFTVEPLETFTTHTRQILLFTNDITTDRGNYGLRTPLVLLRNSSRRLHIVTGTDANPNDNCEPTEELPLNVPTTVRIEVLGTTRKVFYDDVEVWSDSIGTRSQLAGVGVYRQNEFYSAANARLSNIVFDSIPSSTNYETARYGDLISEREAVTTRQHLATLVKPPTDYVLQFTIEPLGTVNVESSILTFTTGNVAWSGQNQYGDRVPMVTFRPDSTRLVVSVGTDADPYYYVEVVDSLPVGIESTVRIEVLGTLLRIFVDNVEKITQVIGTRSQLAEVKAYLGIIDAANAMVSHVTFTKCTNLSSSTPSSSVLPSLLPSVLPSLVPSASFMPSVDQCKNCNDYDLFDCEFLLHQTKQDATAICGFISREKSVKQYCQNQLFKKYKTCTMTKAPSSIPSKVPSISSIPSKVPSIAPCHGISLVLSDDDKGTILSDNSSNEAIVKCFDTSEVTNMDQFLMGSNINADLSSWDVSSVTSMWVSCCSSQYMV